MNKTTNKMKQLAILLLLAVAISSSCKKLDIEEGTPKCVEEKIEDFNKSSSCDDANVKEFTFQGKIVYTFEPGTCGADMTASVFDSECSYLGYLGGISGNSQINGEDFANATFVKTIWKK